MSRRSPMVRRMSGVAYGTIVRHPGPVEGTTWTGMILSRLSGALGIRGDPIWSLIVIDDDEDYWHPGDVVTIPESQIMFYRLTPDDAGA